MYNNTMMSHHLSKQTENFFTSSTCWDLYTRIIHHNYMFHQELYREVSRLLKNKLQAQPFRLLDMGCGDGSFIIDTLSSFNVSHYKGIDISELSLAKAQQNSMKLNCKTEFCHADILTGIQQETETYDIILASFALHHLSSNDKELFFYHCYKKLAPKGLFILIDVIRKEHETLEDYLNHYCHYMKSQWTVFNAEDLDFICSHVRDHDLPETLSFLNILSDKAGFSLTQPHYKKDWYHLVLYER